MNRSQKEINVQAKTLELALQDAAENLGVGSRDVEYELVSRTDAGFLSFLGGKKVVIRAWAKTKSRRPVKADQPPAEELSKEELTNLVNDLKDFCGGICKYISGEEVKVTAEIDGEKLTLNIDDEYLASQIGKNTRLAESLEHILRKKPRYLKRELPFRIFIDARGIRTARETELIDMARDLSSKVVEKQRPIVLNYKSSYDRKIIHMALDGDNRVYTKSIGSGANRKLMILPAKTNSGDSVERGSH